MHPTSARKLLRITLRGLLSILLPARCFGCKRSLNGPAHLGACLSCWTGLSPLSGPFCPGCALPRPPGTDLLGPAGGRCAACLVEDSALDAVIAAVPYDALARRFLLRAKLAGRPELLPALGLHIVPLLGCAGWASRCTMLIPVPSDPWSGMRRGFAPAKEIARIVSRRSGIPLYPVALRRRQFCSPALKRLGRRERQIRSIDAYRVRGDLSGERPLLVDDVMTTGATLDSCARALKAAGATEVRAVVWGRTLIET